jgi:hypothetical protein
MKNYLTSFAITAVLLTTSVSVWADDADAWLLQATMDLSSPPSLSLIHDQDLSTMRAQGFKLPEFDTGVILWDEVDSGAKPKPHHATGDGVFTVTVE